MSNGKKVSIYLSNEAVAKLDDIIIGSGESMSNLIGRAINTSYPFYFEKLKLSDSAIIAIKNGKFNLLDSYIEADGTVTISMKANGYLTLKTECDELNHKLDSLKNGNANNVFYVHYCDSNDKDVKTFNFSTIEEARAHCKSLLFKAKASIGSSSIAKEEVNEDNVHYRDTYVLVANTNRSVFIHIVPAYSKDTVATN